MENIFYKVVRDATVDLPKRNKNASTQHTSEVLPFEFSHNLYFRYYSRFNDAVYSKYLKKLTKYEEERLTRSIVKEVNPPPIPYWMHEYAGSAPVTSETKEVLDQYHQTQKPTNPHIRFVDPRNALEFAVFNALLVLNKYHAHVTLRERELYYIFKEALHAIDPNAPRQYLGTGTNAKLPRIAGPVYRLAANVIYNELQGNDHIVLLDWYMLPSLMLLLPALEEDTKVNLPPYDEELMKLDAYKLLIKFLKQAIPRITWHVTKQSKYDFPKDCLVLGAVAAGHYSIDAKFLQNMSCLRGGFLYCSWNFLARATYTYARYDLIKADIVRAIIQLPKLLRTGSREYNAGIVLARQDNGREDLRMAHLPASTKEGEDALDMEQALHLINDAAEIPEQSCQIHREQVRHSHDLRLLPSYYFAEMDFQGTGKKLGDYADILFYHKPRKKIQVDDPKLTSTDLNDDFEVAISGNICVQEISLNDIDASSSFVFAEDRKFAEVKMNASQRKYLVKEGDIILSFKGSAISIGKSGLVVDTEGLTLSNQSTCIIRPLPQTDNIWLFYQLKSPKVQNWIRAQASGTNSLVISIEVLKSLPLEPYNSKLANDIDALHRLMLENYTAANKHKQNLRKIREEIKNKIGW